PRPEEAIVARAADRGHVERDSRSDRCEASRSRHLPNASCARPAKPESRARARSRTHYRTLPAPGPRSPNRGPVLGVVLITERFLRQAREARIAGPCSESCSTRRNSTGPPACEILAGEMASTTTGPQWPVPPEIAEPTPQDTRRAWGKLPYEE